MRAKFHVEAVTKHAGGNESVKLMAVHDHASAEHKSFALATPLGELTMRISNPELYGCFEPGSRFYLDFTKAE